MNKLLVSSFILSSIFKYDNIKLNNEQIKKDNLFDHFLSKKDIK